MHVFNSCIIQAHIRKFYEKQSCLHENEEGNFTIFIQSKSNDMNILNFIEIDCIFHFPHVHVLHNIDYLAHANTLIYHHLTKIRRVVIVDFEAETIRMVVKLIFLRYHVKSSHQNSMLRLFIYFIGIFFLLDEQETEKTTGSIFIE